MWRLLIWWDGAWVQRQQSLDCHTVLRYVTWACLGCSRGDENFLEERNLSQVKGRVQEGLPGGGGARSQTG